MQVPEITEESGKLLIESNISKKELQNRFAGIGYILLLLLPIVTRRLYETMSKSLLVGAILLGGIVVLMYLHKIREMYQPKLVLDFEEEVIKRRKQKAIPFHTIQNVEVKTTRNIKTEQFYSAIINLIFTNGKVYFLGEYDNQIDSANFAERIASVIHVPIINDDKERIELPDTKLLIREYALSQQAEGQSKWRMYERKDIRKLFLVKEDGTETFLAQSSKRDDIIKYSYQLAKENQTPIYFEPSEERRPVGWYSAQDKNATANLVEMLKTARETFWLE